MEKRRIDGTSRQPLPIRALFRFDKHVGLSLLFLLLIFLPLADMVFHIRPTVPINEKRKLAEVPHFAWRRPWDYLKEFDAFFKDHFGFRTQLLYGHNLLTVTCFHTSPTDKVLLGRQGWLFMAKETEKRDELAYFRSLRPFTAAELEHWRLTLCQRRQWLEKRGISYVFVIVPNKSTIYPEYMPGNIRRLHAQSRLDQLLVELGREKDFPVIDLRERMLAAKRLNRIYDKTDSHWNDLGAYVAYQSIIEKLAPGFPGLKAAPLSAFTVERRERIGGDLAIMLALQKKYFREQEILLKPAVPAPPPIVAAMKNLGPLIRESIVTSPGGSLPTALMVHDSFIHQLQPLLSPHFKRIIYIWDWDLNFFPEIIRGEKARIVIEEMAERELGKLEVKNPAALESPLPTK